MSNVNRVVKGAQGGQGFSEIALPCADATTPVAQGDLVYLDASAHILKPVTSDALAANFAGLALQPSKINSGVDNTTAAVPTSLMVGYSGLIASLKTTAAEVYTVGQLLYIGADAQTVTNVSGTNSIGKALEAKTGAASVEIKVFIKSLIL